MMRDEGIAHIRKGRDMRIWKRFAITLMVVLLAACAQAASLETTGDSAVTSAALDTPYEGTLDAAGQLALGTLQLEDSGNAVSRDQASDLLPLWQALRSGALQGDAETQAVLKQVDEMMTPEQLADIAAMQLTQADVQSWMQEHGMVVQDDNGRLPEGEEGDSSDVSPDRTARTSELANMSDEERQAMRDEKAASGIGRGGSEAASGWRAVLGPLVDLLSERATS